MLRRTLIQRMVMSLCTFAFIISCTQNTQAPAPSPAGSSTGGAVPAADNAIPIGIAVAQTSNTSLLGQEQVIGAKIAETYFNQNGGVNGRSIRLMLQDTAGDEQGAINAFNTLIRRDKVVGIVGPTLSQQAFGADPIAEQQKVPVLGPSNTAKGIPQIGQYIARVSSGIAVVAPNAVDAALKINPQIKNVAVFYAQNDAFSKSETEVFQVTLKEKGLTITTVQKFLTTDTDFQAQATNALDPKKFPELIVVSGLAADGGNLVKQLRELEYKGIIIGGNGLNTSNILPVCKQYCDGLIIAQAYSPELDTPINKAFKEAYKAQKQKEPPQFTAQAFTAVQVFVEALKAVDAKKKIGDMSVEELRVALNEQILVGKYETPLGAIAFDKDGDVQQSQFYVAQIKMEADGINGKFSYLK